MSTINMPRFLNAVDAMLTMVIDMAKLLNDTELEFEAISIKRRLVIHFGDAFQKDLPNETCGDPAPRERTDH